MLRAILEAQLGERPTHERRLFDASHGARGDHTGIPCGEESGLAVFLNVDGLHVHRDGHADARVTLPVCGLLTARGARVDEQGIVIEDIREGSGVGVPVLIDGGDDAVLAQAQDVAGLVFADSALGQLCHRLMHGRSFR